MASFSVVSNISASNAQANLATTNVGLQRALTRLSSGFRINYAGDDAAGLAVANSYRSKVAVLNQGIRNANDGLSSLQIKDGALGNIGTLLDRLATLATQSASGANDDPAFDRTKLQDEFQTVLDEIDREANVAGLDDNDHGFSVYISADASSDGATSYGKITGTITGADTSALGIDSEDISDVDGAESAVTAIKDAVAALGAVQGVVGSLQNQLQFATSLAQSQIVNTRAAESRIRDANVAEEAANLTRYQILTQSGIAALAQANQSSSGVLTLLR